MPERGCSDRVGIASAVHRVTRFCMARFCMDCRTNGSNTGQRLATSIHLHRQAMVTAERGPTAPGTRAARGFTRSYRARELALSWLHRRRYFQRDVHRTRSAAPLHRVGWPGGSGLFGAPLISYAQLSPTLYCRGSSPRAARCRHSAGVVPLLGQRLSTAMSQSGNGLKFRVSLMAWCANTAVPSRYGRTEALAPRSICQEKEAA